jgi:hypothetical protein
LHGTREALRSWGVLTEIRRLLAFSLALMVLILTLGRVPVNWTGAATGAGGGADGRRGIATESEPAGR